MKKGQIIGLAAAGLLAVAGIGFFIYKKVKGNNEEGEEGSEETPSGQLTPQQQKAFDEGIKEAEKFNIGKTFEQMGGRPGGIKISPADGWR